MKKSNLLLLLPTAFFPYIPLIVIAAYGVEKFLYEKMTVVLTLFIVLWTLSIICNVLFMIKTRDESKNLLRIALILKIIHIPFYVFIFILGVITAVALFMILPIVIVYVVFDYVTLCLSSMVSLYSLSRNTDCNSTVNVICMVMQFIFCLDVFSMIAINIIARRSVRRYEQPY